MTVRAVLFDLFDTLVWFPPTGVRDEGIRLAAAAGIPEQRWIASWRSTADPAMRGGIFTLEDRIRRSLIAAGLVRPPQPLVDALVSSRLRQTDSACSYPDVTDTLVRLRQQGPKLALVGNIFPYETGILDRLALRGLFDAVVLSCELRICKPEPGIYLAAAQRLSAEPAECVFVGDGLSDELSGARAVGATAVRIERTNRSDDAPRDEAFDHRIRDLAELLDWLRGPAVKAWQPGG